MRRARGEVELDHVTLAIGAGPALDDVTLRIPAGGRVALMGAPEALEAVAARLLEPDAGGVLRDGGDARDRVATLERGDEFSGTVAECIAGRSGATREEVVAAAKGAGAHAFVSELPEHYETPLAPCARSLSEGQRRRIAIARLLLRDPPVLLLHEPTASLEPLSERLVTDGLRLLMRDRTTLLLTRSPALARCADRVVVLADGRIERDGAPEALLAPPSRRAIPAPADPALPALGRLLDAEAMATVLQRSLPPGSPPPDVRIGHLRYQPGDSVVAHYDAGVGGRWHDVVARVAARASMAKRAARAENVALAARVAGRPPAREPLAYEPELGALLQWLPLDISLPALAESPAELASALGRSGVDVPEEEPAVLSYRSRRRAVLRLGDHVLKVYRSNAVFERAIAGLLASVRVPALRAPAFEAALPELRLTAQALLRGSPPPHEPATVRATAVLVRELHGSGLEGLPERPARAQLASVAAAARLAGALVPELTARLERLVAQLEAGLPAAGPPVPSHGDFHTRQVMSDGVELALIDFDRICAAPAALDLANYAAHLVRGAGGELEEARAALAQLVEGYGQRPAALDWYFASAILRRAPVPFRYLDDHWPERVRAIAAAAESALAG